jgi:hypothetical protein
LRLKYLRRGNCHRSRKTGDSNQKRCISAPVKMLTQPTPTFAGFLCARKAPALEIMRLGGDSVKGGRI